MLQVFRNLCVFERRFVRYGQFLATFGASRCQYLTTLGRSHALTESVFVDPFPARRLVCSLHCHSYTLYLLNFGFFLHAPVAIGRCYWDCKSTTKKQSAKIFREKIPRKQEKARIVVNFVHTRRNSHRHPTFPRFPTPQSTKTES